MQIDRWKRTCCTRLYAILCFVITRYTYEYRYTRVREKKTPRSFYWKKTMIVSGQIIFFIDEFSDEENVGGDGNIPCLLVRRRVSRRDMRTWIRGILATVLISYARNLRSASYLISNSIFLNNKRNGYEIYMLITL